ncbi:hypothetical protein D3C85_1594820 [compost metagenome]
MLGEVAFEPFIAGGTALAITFSVNYVTSYLLIRYTGGGRDSQFTPVIFLLPTLALFLRMSGTLVILYGLATGYCLLATIGFSNTRQSAFSASYEYPGQHSLIAFQVVTLLCLAVTIVTGYITRPQVVL